jgi:DNA-binding CsgD family transcriptional regulator
MLTQQDGVRLFRASQISRIDNELPRLTVPVLVLHPREVQRPSLDECAELVALIPGARLVEISGGWPLLDGDFDSALPFIERFLTERLDVAPPAKRDAHSLSARELDVLRLLTVGRSNRQVANELVISLSTVAKHVTSILDKTGAANRTEAAVYARDHGLA